MTDIAPIAPAPHGARNPSRRHNAVMASAAIAFALNIWAWMLLVPLEPDFQQRFGLGPSAQAALLAGPLVIGLLGRIPVGALTDRFGPRVMFPAVGVAAAAAVALLTDEDSLTVLLVADGLLGVAGTAFAVGAPLISRGYRRPALALGLFGVGLGGAAVCGVTSQLLYDAIGRRTCLLVLAALLAGSSLLTGLLVGPAARAESFGSARGMVGTLLRVPGTRRLAALYAVAFGGLAALALYLPVYLTDQYRLGWGEALWRSAGMMALAAAAHVLGTWSAGRRDPTTLLTACFGVAGLGVLAQASQPPLEPFGAVVIAAVAVSLGTASGAAIGVVAAGTPPHRIGALLSTFGAIGGLGGLVPLLLLSGVYDIDGSYTLALTALAGAAMATAGYAQRRPRRQTHVDLDELLGWLRAIAGAPTARSLTTVVALPAIRASAGRDGEIFAALAELAGDQELVVVYGTDPAVATLTPHRLVDGLRRQLPRCLVVGLLDSREQADPAAAQVIGALLNDGALVVVVSSEARPGRHAASLGDRLGADRLLDLTRLLDLPMAGTRPVR